MVGTRQFSESEMLDKALSIFWKKGYHATSMIDLANETGVQRGSLYNAYNNKETLFIKAFTHYSERLLSYIEASLAHPDLKIAITQFFESFVDRLCSDPNNKGCLSTRAIMEANEKDEEIREKLTHLLNSIENLIQRRLDRAREDGQFGGDSQEIARYLVALSRGLAVLERVYYDQSRMRDIYCSAIRMLPIY